MPALWEKTGDANGNPVKDNSDLKEVDLSNFRVSGRTGVYLPGRDQCDGNPTELSKGVHFVNKLFTDLPEPPKVYIWSHSDMYSKNPIKDLTSIFHVAAYSHLPHYRGAAAKKLAKGVIMPLVVDKEGKPLPFEEAQKNLRNLTLLGYCLGSVTAQEAYNASVKMMKKAGYNKEDANDLLREIVLVSFATFTRPEKETHRYTTVNFINNDDLFISMKNIVVLPLHTFAKVGKIFSTASHKLKIKQLSQTSVLVSAEAREKPLGTILGEKPQEVIEDVILPGWKLGASNHLAKDYVNDNDEGNQLAGMVKYAVINAVTRKDTVTPLSLLKEPVLPQQKPEDLDDQYNRKVVGGLYRGARPSMWKKIFNRGI